jgi:hypothetical protein
MQKMASELTTCPQFAAATWQEHWSGFKIAHNL